jgi:glycosyltransferase involved in cell wall biosynthesis
MADKKIKMLVIPSDHTGVGKFRSIDPHVYIAEHYKDEFDIDVVYNLPKENLDKYLSQYDLIHIHKQLDKNCEIMKMIKFLEIPVIIDVDDHYKLGNDHPMSLSAKKEKWHEPIINHIKLADYVTTTTPIFAEELRKHNKNVFVFPNAINPDEPQYKQMKTKSNMLRIGIICGSSHLHDIELLGDLVTRTADNVQIVLCGFDTNGTITTYNQETGEKTQRPIKPEESVWFKYEKILTGNYKTLSAEHKDFLMKFMKGVDDPFVNEKYRRMWTRDINKYATHYENVDVLLAPLKENEFNKMKSQLKTIEAGFTNTALIAQDFGAYQIDSIPMIEFGGKINENGNCLLVKSNKNHKDWVKYINKLAANPEMVKKLQDNLHNYVKDKYSIDAVCKERVEFYKNIVNKSVHN